ncbi:TOG array regulator of axonemal microtubules protein 2-like [Etheostoma cragini]|uniref:TOG array regulator of axonemal microtubules protein 2-like n=1 Tax=Etheostoma cragini TaxID=417921 RepID=UPI00155E218C|nr:TOG array regulator of axonemal microtubules protein 2-like [Etheostoma cragini]
MPHPGTLAMAPKVPAPPSEAAPAHRKGPRCGFLVVAPKSAAPPSEAAPPDRSGLHHGTPAVAPRVPVPPSEPAPAHRKGPPRGTLAVSPKSPTPTSEAAPPSRKGPCSGTLAVPPKSPASPLEAAPPSRKGPRSDTKCPPIEDLRPLVDPEKSLSLCFTQLTTDNWEENMKGLKSVRALARHHPEHLQTQLHEVCLVLTEAVKNLRSAVACSAMSTLAELHTQLGKAMDKEAQWTGHVLLLKLAQTTNAFIHQQANLALDALVESCSTSRVISVLLNTGLSHRCAAVRGCTAQHLHQLADILGEEQILTAGKTFTQSFLIAVSKMAVDASPDVRYYGQKILKGLAHQKGFAAQWERTIPVKDRRPLDKILQKLGQ